MFEELRDWTVTLAQSAAVRAGPRRLCDREPAQRAGAVTLSISKPVVSTGALTSWRHSCTISAAVPPSSAAKAYQETLEGYARSCALPAELETQIGPFGKLRPRNSLLVFA